MATFIKIGPDAFRCLQSGCVMSEGEQAMHAYALAVKARHVAECELPKTAQAVVTQQQAVIGEMQSALADVMGEVQKLRAELAMERGKAPAAPPAIIEVAPAPVEG